MLGYVIVRFPRVGGRKRKTKILDAGEAHGLFGDGYRSAHATQTSCVGMETPKDDIPE